MDTAQALKKPGVGTPEKTEELDAPKPSASAGNTPKDKAEVKNEDSTKAKPAAPNKKRQSEVMSDSEEDNATPIRKLAKKSENNETPSTRASDFPVPEPPFPGCDPDVPLTQREKAQFMIELSRWGIAAGFDTASQRNLLQTIMAIIEEV